MPFDYETSTAPFFRVGGAAPALINLRQIGDDTFAILDSFEYRQEGALPFVVDKDVLTSTNLATIPTWLGWFMRRHGRHTPAALMHDLRVRESLPGPEVPYGERVVADAAFRDALRRSEVRPVRAALMWTAVTLGTLLSTRRSDPGRFGLLLSWVVAAVLGIALLGWGIAQGDPVLILLALLAPALAGLLWERQWQAGIIAGYALPIVLFGSIPPYLAFTFCRFIEWFYVAGEPEERTPATTWETR